MKNKKVAAPRTGNTAIDSFRLGHSKGFIRSRFFATIIDFLIISLLCQLVFTLFKTPDWERYLKMQDMVKGLPASDPQVLERMKLYQESFIVTLSIGMAYEALMLLLFGASVGKLLFGLRVVNVTDDRNSYVAKLMLVLRAAIKALSIYLLSALPFLFMCLTAFGNPEGRSGFDMFAGTKVVYVRRNR